MINHPNRKKVKATANSAAIDPVFAAIAEHKAQLRESNRLEADARAARDKEEKNHGEWTRAPKPGEWPGEATVSPFYDRWNRACRAERKVAIRMARTEPATISGVAAMIVHARQAIETDREVDWRDWVPTVLKTVASALTRMDNPPSLPHLEASRAERVREGVAA